MDKTKMDKAKKKQIKKITTWVLLAALVAGLAAMPLLAQREAEADGPVATVHSGTVEEGSIRTTLRGGGTLHTEDVEDVILPTGVKITEFLVKNGDAVKAGAPLAAVDKVSVMTAITSVTETMEYLQEEMKSAKNEKVDSTISATAGGRVKKVFAQKGDNVQEVMLKHGALALLSLDGLMAVEIEKKLDILTGDTVTVTLEDGEEVTGRIFSNLDGVIVITVEDAGYEIGQTVTVTGKDGSEIGTGALEVHNAWAATAYSGIINTAPAKEETKVSAGSTLFTLTDTDFRGKLEYLSSLHREYEELMQDLFKMYNSGTIDAPCDGTISGVDKDSAHLLAVETGEPVQASLLTVEEGNWEVVLLDNTVLDQPAPADATACTICGTVEHTKCIEACISADLGTDCPAETHRDTCIEACQSSESCPATVTKHTLECIHSCIPQNGTCTKDVGFHKDACIKSCVHSSSLDECKKGTGDPHYLDCIHSCIQSSGTEDCPSIKHTPGCIEHCTHADTIDQCTATPYHYLDCIKSCKNSKSSNEDCPATKHHDTCFFAAMTYKAQVLLVQQVGTTDLVVRRDSSNKSYDVVKTAAGWKFVNPSDFNPALLVNEGSIAVGNPKAFRPGDVLLDITGYKGTKDEWRGMAVYTNLSAGGTGFPTGQFAMPDLSALLGSLGKLNGLAGFGNFSFYAPSPVEEEQLFDLEGSTLMTVSPQKTVSLTISLDEQDIAKVQVGQKATVKVEALSGEVFEAEVTEVSLRGTNSGGSSKFTAKLELPKAANMLDGMSATAALPMEQRDNVPVIPVAALAQQGAQTVVYTALDDDGKPANPVPVTIGLSDGLNAELVEGPAVGSAYYYSFYDVLEEDTGVEDRFTVT